VVHIEDHHLSRATGLASALNYTRKSIKPFHEANWAGSDPAAGKRFVAAAQRREISSSTRPPLEQHAFGLRQVHDGIHVVLDRVDEAGRALRLGLHSDVEPDRRIESDFLFNEEMGQLVAKSIFGFRRGEISAFLTPPYNSVYYTAN
jgi:hypothetical protein